MSQFTYALIEHTLSPEEIMMLPERLKDFSQNLQDNDWYWSSDDMDAVQLVENWTKQAVFLSAIVGLKQT